MKLLTSFCWYGYFCLLHLVYTVGCRLAKPFGVECGRVFDTLEGVGLRAAWRRSETFLYWRATR